MSRNLRVWQITLFLVPFLLAVCVHNVSSNKKRERQLAFVAEKRYAHVIFRLQNVHVSFFLSPSFRPVNTLASRQTIVPIYQPQGCNLAMVALSTRKMMVTWIWTLHGITNVCTAKRGWICVNAVWYAWKTRRRRTARRVWALWLAFHRLVAMQPRQWIEIIPWKGRVSFVFCHGENEAVKQKVDTKKELKTCHDVLV